MAYLIELRHNLRNCFTCAFLAMPSQYVCCENGLLTYCQTEPEEKIHQILNSWKFKCSSVRSRYLDPCVPAGHLVLHRSATVQTNLWDCPVQWADPRTVVAIECQVLLSPRHCWLLNCDNEA